MKKSFIALLILGLLACSLFVSCNSDVSAPEALSEELVSVTFDDGSNSKSLTATLETFNKDDYYWKYAAQKNANDTSGLTSGATEAYDEAHSVFIHESTTGLTGKVPGFSQGIWDFKLFAYKRSGEGTSTSPYVYTHVYTGEATGVALKKGSDNTVTVTVSPYTEGQGTLFIDQTPLTPHKTGETPSVSRYLKVQAVGSTEEKLPTSGTTYTLDAGAYLVTVTYKSNDVVFAEGTVIATIYPNLTTTVAGSIDELITYAQFDADLNPDIITKTAGLDGITSETSGDDHGNIKLEEPSTVSEKKVEATLPAAAAIAMLPKIGDVPDPNASMSLALNVDTVDSTSTSVTYEISMTKVVTLNSEVSTSDVTDLGKDDNQNKYYAVATIKLSTGLTGVVVTHDGHDMVNSENTADDAGYGVYSYDATTGILTIQTNTFSPFAVTYDGLSFGVAEVYGVKYPTLVAACEALPNEGGTIKLLSDTEGAGIFLPANLNMNIVLDMDGYTYTCTGPAVGSTGTATQALHLEKNNTVTIKNGTITATPDSGVKMLVQNYCNLTLTDVTLDGSNIGEGRYTLSNNSGTVVLNGSTSIVSSINGKALDSCKYGSYAIPNVTINTTGTIEGIIELSGGKLEIKNGEFEGSISTVSGYHEGDVAIKGGVYNYDPSTYVADGYTVEETEGGKYKVVEEKWVFFDLKRDTQGSIITETRDSLEYCTEIQQVWGKTKTREIERRLVRFTVASMGNISGTSDSAATKFNVFCGETNLTNNPVTLNDLTGRSDNYNSIDSRLVRGDVILLPAGEVVVFGNSGSPSSIQELTIVGQKDGDGKNTTIHCISTGTNQYRMLRIYNRGLNEGIGFGAEIVHTNFLDVNFERSDSNSSTGTALFYITDYNVQLTMKNVKVMNYKGALVSCWASGPTTTNTTKGMPLKEDNAGIDIYLTNVDISSSQCTSVMAAECYPASDKPYSAENWMYRALNYVECAFGSVPVCVNKDNHSIAGQENCFVNGELVDWAVPSQQ